MEFPQQFRTLLVQIVAAQRAIDQLKGELTWKSSSSDPIFQALLEMGQGVVTTTSLFEFLRTHGLHYSQKQQRALIRSFGFSVNSGESVDFNTFSIKNYCPVDHRFEGPVEMNPHIRLTTFLKMVQLTAEFFLNIDSCRQLTAKTEAQVRHYCARFTLTQDGFDRQVLRELLLDAGLYTRVHFIYACEYMFGTARNSILWEELFYENQGSWKHTNACVVPCQCSHVCEKNERVSLNNTWTDQAKTWNQTQTQSSWAKTTCLQKGCSCKHTVQPACSQFSKITKQVHQAVQQSLSQPCCQKNETISAPIEAHVPLYSSSQPIMSYAVIQTPPTPTPPEPQPDCSNQLQQVISQLGELTNLLKGIHSKPTTPEIPAMTKRVEPQVIEAESPHREVINDHESFELSMSSVVPDRMKKAKSTPKNILRETTENTKDLLTTSVDKKKFKHDDEDDDDSIEKLVKTRSTNREPKVFERTSASPTSTSYTPKSLMPSKFSSSSNRIRKFMLR